MHLPWNRTAGLALALTTTVLLAACSSSSTKSSGAGTSAATGDQSTPATTSTTSAATQAASTSCDLLTADEIATATGFKVAPGMVDSEDSDSCKWVVDSGQPGISSVSVGVFPVDQYAGATPSEGVKHVAGVGDEAIWTSLWTLYVRAGQHAFTVQVVVWLSDDARQQATASALALKVLPRL